jgi:copper chaperone CopZ
MSELLLTIPSLFGDHHTTAVHNILGEVEGVESAYVTSAFRQVLVKFDDKKTEEKVIKQALAAKGYEEGELEDVFLEESDEVSTRHTAAVTEILSFAEEAPSWEGRPLWPCPGLEFKTEMED